MPNWCENHLSIYGPDDDMQNILDVIRIGEDDYMLLESLYPTPIELMIGDASIIPDEKQLDNLTNYGYKSWYEWRIAKWGCKWPESDLSVGQDYTNNGDGTSVIAFNFDTPWAPPIEAFDKISQDYPNLLFCLYYEEPGMGFCGSDVWAKGEKQQSESGDLISKYFDEQHLYEEYIGNN